MTDTFQSKSKRFANLANHIQLVNTFQRFTLLLTLYTTFVVFPLCRLHNYANKRMSESEQ